MTVPPSAGEEEALGKGYDARLMRRLLRYLRPHLGAVVGGTLALIAASGLQVVGPWLTQQAIDQAIPAGDPARLGTLALLFLGALALSFLLEFAQTVLTSWVGQRIMVDLRREVFDRFQRLDLAFHDRNPVGRLITRITSDVETLNELFSSGLVSVFGDIFTLVFIVGAMLWMDLELALVSFSVLPFVALTVAAFRRRIREAFRDIRTRLARINAFLHERITGIRVVQLFNREEADQAALDRINRDYLEAHLRSITYYALFFPIIEVFTAVALALILVRGSGAIADGATTVGIVAAFLQYARRFFRPIQDLADKYNLLQGAMASSERIFALLDEEPRIQDPADPRPLPRPIRGEIEFDDVWFAYGPRADGTPDWVLRGVRFRVRSGETLALVGATGAGKSTVIQLLLRFHDPQRGEIRLDGIPIRSLGLSDLRGAIALVLQDVFLFSGDIAGNIRLGNDAIGEDRILRAVEEAGALPLIGRLEGGLHHPIGERGANLSVGERQLLSFARALAFDPAILVLDEATSSVDSELEERIEEATARLTRGRSCLVIAHRLSTIRSADRILVLHEGRVAEEGTHEELLRAEGLYAGLHELQSLNGDSGESLAGPPP